MELIKLDILLTQIVGFLIVFWVLKRYAWKPVLGMLEERRRRVHDEVHTAQKLREDAERVRGEVEEQLRGIAAQERARIQAAVAEGQKLAEEIREKARQEARAITEKARADLDQEYKKARAGLRDEMVGMALAAAERLLQERMDADEHRRLVEKFLSELSARENA